MAASTGCSKLLVKKLPSELTGKDKEDLLKHFGAQDVICMDGKGRMPDAVFATFPDEQSASKALSRLHQLEVLGSRLVVEYAKSCHENQASTVCSRTSYKQRLLPDDPRGGEVKELSAETSETLSSNELKPKPRKPSEGINPKLGIHYQPSRSLHYLYPPPTPEVLTNILNTLACVPKLYVQVLHLMNKMNLPCPFGAVTPTPPLPSLQAVQEEDSDKFLSSEESELESDEEERERRAQEKASIAKRKDMSKTDSKQHKRTRLHISKPLPKKAKLAESGSSLTSAPVPVESAFDQPAGQQTKKIEFKLLDSVSVFETGLHVPLVSAAQAPPHKGDGFGTFAPPDMPSAPQENKESEDDLSEYGDDDDENDEVISLQEIARNRMPEEERRSLSAFKNYRAGEPSSRLYVKNLAKQVEEEDLRYIFNRYVKKSSAAEKISFDIRLMKEGRMKGQAFISLPSEGRAKRALREVHGYILHGKPMVIQFSRSNKAKD